MYMYETEIRFSAKKDLFGGSWGGGVHIYVYIYMCSYIYIWGLELRALRGIQKTPTLEMKVHTGGIAFSGNSYMSCI